VYGCMCTYVCMYIYVNRCMCMNEYIYIWMPEYGCICIDAVVGAWKGGVGKVKQYLDQPKSDPCRKVCVLLFTYTHTRTDIHPYAYTHASIHIQPYSGIHI